MTNRSPNEAQRAVKLVADTGPHAGLSDGPLPLARGRGAVKSRWRLLAEKIVAPGLWFEWKDAHPNADGTVKSWAKGGLPVKAYRSLDGGLVVCHRDAVIPVAANRPGPGGVT